MESKVKTHIVFQLTSVYNMLKEVISKGGVSMPDLISNIVYGFALQIKRLLGKDLSNIIVYGSYARGDYHDSSDVDVMILTKLSEEEIKKIDTQIYDLAYDIELEKGIHISVVIKNEEHFCKMAKYLPST